MPQSIFYYRVNLCSFSEANHHDFLARIQHDYVPVVAMARSILLTIIYGILIVSSAIVIIHWLGCLLLLVLRKRNFYPTRPVFILSFNMANVFLPSTLPSSAEANRLDALNQAPPAPFTNLDDVDTDHSILSTSPNLQRTPSGRIYGTPQHTPPYTNVSTIKPIKPGAQPLTDMGYSETKV